MNAYKEKMKSYKKKKKVYRVNYMQGNEISALIQNVAKMIAT